MICCVSRELLLYQVSYNQIQNLVESNYARMDIDNVANNNIQVTTEVGFVFNTSLH